MNELIEKGDKDETMIEDREMQKKLVHPYRKYQLWIIVSIIMTIILGVMAFNLNSELDTLLKTEQNLFLQVEDLKVESEEIKKFYERVNVNYKDIYALDQRKNVDIIRSVEELNKLSYAIYNDGTISYTTCYKATVDGESPAKFLELCGGMSPNLFLIETVDGYRFAAYTSLYFGDDIPPGFREDTEAFIFSFDTGKRYKIMQPENAVSWSKGYFPMFGKNDIVLGKNILSGSNSYAMYPVSYEKDPNSPGDYILNGGMKKFQIKELEVLNPFIFTYY